MQNLINRIKFVFLFVLSFNLAACANDSTGPDTETEQVSVATVSLVDTTSSYRVPLYAGHNVIDTTDYDLGQQYLWNDGPGSGESFFLVNREKVVVTALHYYNWFIYGDAGVAPTLRIGTDWNTPTSTSSGVKADDETEFVFLVRRFEIDENGNVDFAKELPSKMYTTVARGNNASTRLTLPKERVGSLVNIYQRRKFSCLNNGSTTIKTSVGAVTELTDAHRDREVLNDPVQIREVKVSCQMFTGVAAAQNALAELRAGR